MSKVKQLRSAWWGKLAYFASQSVLDSIIRREPKVIVVEVRPLFIGHGDVLPQNSLSALVGKDGGIGEALDGLSCGGLCRGLSPMDHESSMAAYTSACSPEVGDHRNRRHGTDIVED